MTAKAGDNPLQQKLANIPRHQTNSTSNLTPSSKPISVASRLRSSQSTVRSKIGGKSTRNFEDTPSHAFPNGFFSSPMAIMSSPPSKVIKQPMYQSTMIQNSPQTQNTGNQVPLQVTMSQHIQSSEGITFEPLKPPAGSGEPALVPLQALVQTPVNHLPPETNPQNSIFLKNSTYRPLLDDDIMEGRPRRSESNTSRSASVLRTQSADRGLIAQRRFEGAENSFQTQISESKEVKAALGGAQGASQPVIRHEGSPSNIYMNTFQEVVQPTHLSEAKIKELESQLSSKDAQIAEIQKKLSFQEQEALKSEGLLASTHYELAQKQKEASQLQVNYEYFADKSAQMETKLEQVSKERDRLVESVKRLETKLQELTTSSMASLNSPNKTSNDELLRDIEALRKENACLHSKMAQDFSQDAQKQQLLQKELSEVKNQFESLKNARFYLPNPSERQIYIFLKLLELISLQDSKTIELEKNLLGLPDETIVNRRVNDMQHLLEYKQAYCNDIVINGVSRSNSSKENSAQSSPYNFTESGLQQGLQKESQKGLQKAALCTNPGLGSDPTLFNFKKKAEGPVSDSLADFKPGNGSLEYQNHNLYNIATSVPPVKRVSNREIIQEVEGESADEPTKLTAQEDKIEWYRNLKRSMSKGQDSEKQLDSLISPRDSTQKGILQSLKPEGAKPQSVKSEDNTNVNLAPLSEVTSDRALPESKRYEDDSSKISALSSSRKTISSQEGENIDNSTISNIVKKYQ